MEINAHIHNHSDPTTIKYLQELSLLLITVNNKIDTLMATQAELAQQLTTITDQVHKIGVETQSLLQKVADLETALGNQGNVTPELQAAFDALKAQVQSVDDLVPDTPPQQ